jgi:hypothetical protein
MANGPGGVEVGRVSVRVVPDTSKFLADAKKELKEIAKQLKVTVQVELDTGNLKAELEKIEHEASGKNVKLDIEADGDGAVRETRRIKNFIQKVVGAIKLTVSVNMTESIAKIRAQLKIIQKSVKGYEIKLPIEFVGLSKWLGILGAISAALLTIPHLIGAIGGAVNVVGGALALLPALAAAAAVGITAMVVGLKGFFSALGQAGDPAKFEEALKKLTPNAQDAARALAEFREPLSDIRKAVQDSLFEGMADPLRDLKGLLPPIKSGLVGAAAGIRNMTKAWIKMATSQQSIKDTGQITGNISKMFDNLKPSLANFGQAMRDITVVGSTFLPALGNAVSNVTAKFAAWASSARESGRLDQIIQNAIDKIKQLGRIIADVTVGLKNIFKSMSGGREFLDIIESATQSFREWSQDKGTQETLRRLANVMRTVAQAARELFSQAFKSAGAILKDLEPFLLTLARGIGTFIAGAIRAVTPLLQGLARWFSENRMVLVPLILALATFVTTFKLMVTVAKSIQSVKEGFLAIKAATIILGEAGTAVGAFSKKVITSMGEAVASAWAASGRFIGTWATIGAEAVKQAAITSAAWISSAAKSAAFTARYYAIMAAEALKNWVKMTAAAVANAVKITATWIANLARMVAATIAQMAVAVAAWVANWVRMAAVALAQAARMAAAWLIAMGPIGIIIAAIIALVALVIANWDSIVSVIKTAWDAIWKFISDVITWIVARFNDIWEAVKKVIQWFIDMGQGIIDGITVGLNWLADIGAKIIGFFKDAGKWLFETGKNLVMGLWNGWKAYFDDFQKAVVDDGNTLIDNINDVFGVFSPSRVFRQIGEYLGQGLEIGVHSSMTSAIDEAVRLGRNLTSAFDKSVDVPSNWASNITDALPGALSAVDKLMNVTNSAATIEWKGQLTSDDMQPMEERVLAALATGLTVELDGKNVTKSVNMNNLQNNRRK